MTPLQITKLTAIRQIRDKKLKLVDIAVNRVTLGNYEDISSWKEYRDQLLNITDPYKESPELLDSIRFDQINWPQIPNTSLSPELQQELDQLRSEQDDRYIIMSSIEEMQTVQDLKIILAAVVQELAYQHEQKNINGDS